MILHILIGISLFLLGFISGCFYVYHILWNHLKTAYKIENLERREL